MDDEDSEIVFLDSELLEKSFERATWETGLKGREMIPGVTYARDLLYNTLVGIERLDIPGAIDFMRHDGVPTYFEKGQRRIDRIVKVLDSVFITVSLEMCVEEFMRSTDTKESMEERAYEALHNIYLSAADLLKKTGKTSHREAFDGLYLVGNTERKGVRDGIFIEHTEPEQMSVDMSVAQAMETIGKIPELYIRCTRSAAQYAGLRENMVIGL